LILAWFVIWYDLHSIRCVFYIPSTRLGDRKHITRWINISNHKPEYLYCNVPLYSACTCSTYICLLNYVISVSRIHAHVPYILLYKID
jgi:hypothetical protein